MAQPLQVRFDTTVTLDVATILKDYLESRSDTKYLQLLNLKNDPNVNVSRLFQVDQFNLLILMQYDDL